MQSPFYIHEDLRQVVCKECELAIPILGRGLEKHLERGANHRQLSAMERQRLSKEMNAQAEQWGVSEASEASAQSNGREAIKGIKTVQGYRCLACLAVQGSQKLARQHQVQAHGIKSIPGRKRSNDQGERWVEEPVQSIFGHGSPYHRYFTVTESSREGEDDRQGRALVGEEDLYAGVSQLFQEAGLLRQQERSRSTIDAANKEEQTPWLHHMGWLEHLQGLDLVKVVAASRLPTQHEVQLKAICQAVALTFDRCTQTLKTTDKETRQWWRSPKLHEISLRPLEILQTTNAYARYTGYWQRFIVYCLRCMEVEERQREEEFRVTFSAQQVELLGHIRSCAAIAVDGDEEEEEKVTFKEALVDFIQAFSVDVLQHQFRGLGWSNPLIHFTAVLGINEYTQQLKQPSDYTSTLAGIVYCARLFLLQSCTDTDPDSDQVERSIEHFQSFRQKWLTNGSYCTMSRLLGDLAYGISRARETGASAKVYWEDPETKTKLNYEGRTITADALRTLVQTLVVEARELIWKELLFTDEGERWVDVNLEEISEGLALGKSGTSSAFLDLSSDSKIRDGATFVQRRLFENKRARDNIILSERPSTSDGGPMRFRDSGVRKYKQHVQRFLEKLWVLIHITGGAPARGTEIGCLRYRDALTVNRNLYVAKGEVVFITQYHKGLIMSDKMKVIPRFLPSAVGALLALYLSYVRPFTDNVDLTHDGPPTSDYLWSTSKGTSWETDRMSKALSDCGERLIGIRLTIRSYRQIAVAYSKDVVHAYLPISQHFQDFATEDERVEQDLSGIGEEDAAALQTAHSSRSRRNHYAISSDSISRLSSKSLEVFREVSYEWHRFLGFNIPASERQQQKGHKRQLSTVTLRVRTPEAEASVKRVRSSQRPRDSNTPRPALGPATGSHGHPSHTTIPIADQGMDSAITPNAPNKRHFEQLASQTLKSVFGWTRFKSIEQLEAIIAILQGEKLLTTVLPTGGGKSLLFMLPAAMEKIGATIVIVPFLSLMTDLRERCERHGLTVHEWDPNEPTKYAQITVLVVNKVTSTTRLDGEDGVESFLQLASSLKYNGILKRLVFDECHTIVTQAPFRDVMSKLYHLRNLSVQTLFLTATLPPTLIAEFESAMVLQDMRYIRASSFRPNIQMRVQKCPNGRAITAGVRLVKELLANQQPGQRIVVYCRTKSVAQLLSSTNMLDCPCYHAGLTTMERSDCLRRWIGSETGCLVATTAFGTGVDMPGIHHTVHINLPYGLVDLIQESGRGGRDGQASASTVIVEERESEGPCRLRPNFNEENMAALQRYLQTIGCRSLILTRFLDGGDGKTCAEAGALPCDHCLSPTFLPTQVPPPMTTTADARPPTSRAIRVDGQALVQTKVQRDSVGLQRLTQVVQRLGLGNGKLCPPCYVNGGTSAADHSYFSCTANPALGFDACQDFLRTIQWPSNHGICWRCGLWEGMCKGVSKARGSRGECEHKQVVGPIALVAQSSSWLSIRTLRLAGEESFSDFDYTAWLGAKYPQRLHGIRATNAIAVLDLVAQHFEEQ